MLRFEFFIFHGVIQAQIQDHNSYPNLSGSLLEPLVRFRCRNGQIKFALNLGTNITKRLKECIQEHYSVKSFSRGAVKLHSSFLTACQQNELTSQRALMSSGLIINSG